MLEKRVHSSHKKSSTLFKGKLKHHCHILGLEDIPTAGELKAAYKSMVKQWHPDRFQDKPEMEPIAVEKTQQLNQAYRFLLDYLHKEDETKTSEKTNGNHAHNTRHVYSWQTYSDGFPDTKVIEFFLNSSHLISTGYNKQRRILYLKFLGDEIFLYFDVPVFIFEHLLRSRSPGKYALKFIYNRFRYRKFTRIV